MTIVKGCSQLVLEQDSIKRYLNRVLIGVMEEERAEIPFDKRVKAIRVIMESVQLWVARNNVFGPRLG